MKVVALISGGKDSCFNIMQCIAAGHEIIALANLQPHNFTEIDSYMYQSVGHEAIELIAKSMQLPLYRKQTLGTSHHRNLNYVPTENDEVEDLFSLLQEVKTELDIEGVSVGAILSDYQRIRVENICFRLDLVPLAYLWRRNQNELLQEMIKCEIDAVIIKVAALGLEPSRHLGRSLRLVEPHLQTMHEKYGLNMCGEGGEYETLVLDCPLYSSRIIMEESEIVIHSDDPISPVGFLKLNKLRLETKLPQLDLYARLNGIPLKDSDGYITDQGEEASEFIDEEAEEACEEILSNVQNGVNCDQFVQEFTCAKSSGGWLWIGGLCGNSEDCCEALNQALEKLKSNLANNNQRLEDVCSVCLYISDMSKFDELNKTYKKFLSHINPPSRACVQVPMPKYCPLVLEVLSWSPITDAPAESAIDRFAMHVQSISHWAPANIGPYSQAVRIGELLFISGQIGLVPGDMKLIKGGIKYQCQLTLRHVSRVLAAVDSNVNLRDVVQAVCYVTDRNVIQKARKTWETKTNNAIVDYVVVSALPHDAAVEWHVWAHRYNNSFEYEETGKCVDDWSISIYRRWNYDNNIAAIVCHIGQTKEKNLPISSEICQEAFQYILHKLQQGHETDQKCICSLKIFYNLQKPMALPSIIEILNDLQTSVALVYTLVPVLDLYNESTYLSVCGIRIQ